MGLTTTTHEKDALRLVYLWCDVPRDQSSRLREELATFAQAANADGVDFRSLTYQEFIMPLAPGRDSRLAYIDYVSERYL